MSKNSLPILLIEPAYPQGIVFSQSPLSNISVWQWCDLVTSMLEFAFQGRTVCFITPDEETAWYELDFHELYPNCESRRVLSYDYLCAFDPTVKLATLKTVANSQDFYLGPIWLAALKQSDRRRWDDLMIAKLSAGVNGWPQTTEELIYSNPDGDWICWLNPARPEHLILAELNRLAQEVGWDIKSS